MDDIYDLSGLASCAITADMLVGPARYRGGWEAMPPPEEIAARSAIVRTWLCAVETALAGGEFVRDGLRAAREKGAEGHVWVYVSTERSALVFRGSRTALASYPRGDGLCTVSVHHEVSLATAYPRWPVEEYDWNVPYSRWIGTSDDAGGHPHHARVT